MKCLERFKSCMDKIQKALCKLSEKELRTVQSILTKLRSENFVGLDIKKLQGVADVYRVRSGIIRILYTVSPTSRAIILLSVARRSEKTYKKF